ncbi:MAG TPA: DUF3592 domain-containing protein [Herpetosiphonaceae bacterium]
MRIWGFMKRYPGVALILSTFGLAFVLFDAFATAGQLRAAHEIQATVIDSKTATSRTRRGGTRVSGYYPIVSYTHPSGQRREETAITKIGAKPAPGSPITIYVHPTDLRQGVLIKDFWALWGGLVTTGSIGALLFGASLIFYLRRNAGAKPPKPVPAAMPAAFAAPAPAWRDPLQDGVAATRPATCAARSMT